MKNVKLIKQVFTPLLTFVILTLSTLLASTSFAIFHKSVQCFFFAATALESVSLIISLIVATNYVELLGAKYGD